MNNLHPTQSKISKSQREEMLRQRARLIWFTGLSGSGKSTLATTLEATLVSEGFKTYLLDGDNIRLGLNKDLTFDDAGRKENIRRIGEVSKLFLDAGIIVISAFISPFKADRDLVRNIVGSENYFEVYVNTPIEVCEQRDVKGLYAKARKGELKSFTGIDSPYEKPIDPMITIPTHEMSIEDATRRIMKQILPSINYEG